MGKRVVATVVGVLIGSSVVLVGLLVAGMRWQIGPVVDALRRMNRSVTNPRVMRTAGAATVVTRGERVRVDRPALVATADVAGLIPGRTLRTLRLFGVGQCLSLEKT